MRLQTRRREAPVWCLFGLSLVLSSPARGQVVITLANGVRNPPPSVTSVIRETAVADTAALIPPANFGAVNNEVRTLLTDQGFTAANNWIYSFNAADLPPGIVNPVALPAMAPNNAKFNITDYHLYLNGARTAFGETMDFTLQNPPANPVLRGATITPHWLQLINESQRLAGGRFGFAIPGQPGFWALDNGFVIRRAAGDGPFYDSNALPGQRFSVPPTYHDSPEFFSARNGTTYLHFTTIPSWDVSTGGKDYLLVGNAGITWGFSIVTPESSSLMLFGFGTIGLVGSAWRRRWAGARARSGSRST